MASLFEDDTDVFPPLPAYSRPSGLRPVNTGSGMPKTVKWLGDDGLNVFVEIQGHFAAIAIRKGPMKKSPAKRRAIMGFSAASRLRMFKVINRLKLEEAGLCTFVTLTYPDCVGRLTPPQLTDTRTRMHRALERLFGGSRSGLWRMEWAQRKSGRFVGTYMPHVHTVYFGVPYVPQSDVQRIWTRILSSTVPARVDLRKVKNLRMMLYYVSKYLAKVDPLGSLVIPSYLNTHLRGRKWGVYRKELLPWAEKTELRLPPGDLVDAIREIATRHWSGTPQVADMGFTIFGPAAQEIEQLIARWSGHLPDGQIG